MTMNISRVLFCHLQGQSESTIIYNTFDRNPPAHSDIDITDYIDII